MTDRKAFIEQTLDECKRRLYRTLRDLTTAELAWRPTPEANSIGFMLWHVARVEDRWLHRFAQDTTEIWTRDGWAQRCGVPAEETGVGYTAAQLATFSVPAVETLQGYFDAVRQATVTYLQGLDDNALDVHPGRVPFPEISPRPLPDDFTIARMFRQLIGEENQHLGQIAYVRGLQHGLDK
jgi:uncharacterized damage-inducible protein DinB